MNFTEYLTYQPPPGFKDELIHGEIVLSPSANRKHADICHSLSRLLEAALLPEFVVRLDITHRLGDREGPRPDVFVIGRRRWIDAGDGFPEGSPELAIEILSPSNTEKKMRVKRELYLSDPRCLEVWEVDLTEEQIVVYTHLRSTNYGKGKRVPLPSNIGPGDIAVDAVFEGILL